MLLQTYEFDVLWSAYGVCLCSKVWVTAVCLKQNFKYYTSARCSDSCISSKAFLVSFVTLNPHSTRSGVMMLKAKLSWSSWRKMACCLQSIFTRFPWLAKEKNRSEFLLNRLYTFSSVLNDLATGFCRFRSGLPKYKALLFAGTADNIVENQTLLEVCLKSPLTEMNPFLNLER